MSKTGKYLEPSTDTHVPEEYEGTLEPNYYCRGWNSKRNKYCKHRAGHNTDHTGVGRCSWHERARKATMTHGRYSKYLTDSLKEHLKRIKEEDGERTDLTEEVDMFRALTARFIENYDELVEALLNWNRQENLEAMIQERRAKPQRIPDITTVGKMLQDAANLADKMHAQLYRDAIPKRDFFRIQDAMADSVSNRLRGVEHIIGADLVKQLIDNIADDWSEIKL